MSRPPDGYVRYLLQRAEVVAAAPLADAVRQALAQDPLFRYAERHHKRRVYHGRGPSYGAPLPAGGVRVVVRRSRHGGMFAWLTGDLFVSPRAPHELEMSLRLSRAGVPTPEIIAYAIYRAGPLRRADIVTREIPAARDLGDALGDAETSAVRRAMLDSAARLLREMARAGARHPDLNVKNILLAPGVDGPSTAYVLDVDRVVFGRPDDPRIAQANLKRLTRSLRKWREQQRLTMPDSDLTWLAAAALGHALEEEADQSPAGPGDAAGEGTPGAPSGATPDAPDRGGPAADTSEAGGT